MCQNTAGRSCAMSSQTVTARRTQTLLDKYGVDNPSKSNEIVNKRKATNMQRYGGNAPACSDVVKEKIKETVRNRPIQYTRASTQKRQNTIMSRYGNKAYAQSVLSEHVRQRINQYSYDPEWLYDQHVVQKKTITEIAQFIGISTASMSRRFERLNVDVVLHKVSQTQSAGEEEMYTYIRGLLDEGVEIIRNDRSVLSPKELDIYIPRYNLAFEYCGTFWHSEHNGKHSSYHKQKTDECARRGIRLVQVWSNEWTNKQDLVKSRIRNILRKNSSVIHARKCTIREIETHLADAFFDANHLQGRCSASINYGLFYDDVQLVSVMSFSRDRFSKSDRYELIRFASLRDTNVVGGASRLFKTFIMNFPSAEVVSYSDRRWNTGKVYEQLGFVLSHTSAPNYFYFDVLGDTNKLYSRHTFQKHKLADKLEIFDPTLTEWENMKLNGYDRIWDCGNDVYVFAG